MSYFRERGVRTYLIILGKIFLRGDDGGSITQIKKDTGFSRVQIYDDFKFLSSKNLIREIKAKGRSKPFVVTQEGKDVALAVIKLLNQLGFVRNEK